MPENRKRNEEGGGFFERVAQHPSARRWILIGGIAGIALIFLSSLFSGQGQTEEIPDNTGQQVISAQDYAISLQEELSALISQIEGAGEAQVLVTLERSAEQVYATEGRSSARAESGGSDEEEETTYFSVRGSDGSEQALPVTEVQPVIRGVVIVCPGGGNPAVAERITRAVTTALDLSSARVCVVQAK